MSELFVYFDKLQGLKEQELRDEITMLNTKFYALVKDCLLYTSDAADE